MPPTDEKPVNGFDSIHTEDIEKKAPPVAIKNEDGDELVPQPSSDPRDPLVREKSITCGIRWSW